MKNKIKNTGQVFTWDIILATVLFITFFAILIALWTSTVTKINIAEIQYQTSWLSTAVSEGLVRNPGSPVNWTLDPRLSSIEVIGLADVEVYGNETVPLDRILDADKLLYFINITKNRYKETRNKLFGTGRYDFYMEFYCPDEHSLDCFNNLRADTINGTTNVSCNNQEAFYINNHTVRTDRDLLLTLRFDEGVGNHTHDSSGNDKDAISYGANWTTGRFGKALEYKIPEKDYVEILNYTNLDLPNEMTLSAWIKANTSITWQAIIAKGANDDPRNYFLGIGHVTKVAAFHFRSASGLVKLEGTTPVTDDKWHHIAATLKNNGTVRLFVDGRLENDTVTNSKPSTNPYPVVIGAEYNAGAKQYEYFFGGLIDDVKIWNRSLSDEEIMREYQDSRRACVVGLNTSSNSTVCMVHDIKTVTFMEKINQKRNFNEDIVSLDPTARIKLVIYKKRGSF